ncbi:MAG: hypothetical protein WC516_08045 [Patescibacteria group bacterium]|jgi:hypothetical protein
MSEILSAEETLLQPDYILGLLSTIIDGKHKTFGDIFDKLSKAMLQANLSQAKETHYKVSQYYESVVIPARIAEATGRTPDDTKDSDEFWEPIIYKDGKIDEEQVLKELADFYFMMEQVPKVYDTITNGLLSKPLYKAEVVIGKAQDCAQYDIEEAIAEEKKRIFAEIEKFHIASCQLTVHRYECKDCPSSDFICNWQQLKKQEGVA